MLPGLLWTVLSATAITTRAIRPRNVARRSQRTSARSAARARAARAARCAAGGEGSAITDTVSATLGGDAEQLAGGRAHRHLLVVALGERRPRGPARGRRPSGSGAGPRPRSRSAARAPTRRRRRRRAAPPRGGCRRRSGARGGRSWRRRWRPCMRCSSTGDIACSRRSASSWTSSQGTPRTSVRKRSIRRWRRTMSSACRAPTVGEGDRAVAGAGDVAVALQAADHLVHRRRR